MAMIHIGPLGPTKCVAKSAGSCPYLPPEDHFDNAADAQAEWERRAKKANKTVGALKKKKKLTPHQKNVLEAQKKMLDNYNISRWKKNTSEKDPGVRKVSGERVRERINNAILYAESRDNEHLAVKLARAKVLSTGSFKTSGGDRHRVSVDSVLERDQSLKNLEADRQGLIGAATKKLNSVEWKGDESYKSDDGKVTVKLSQDGFSQENFDELVPKKLQAGCFSDVNTIDYNKAKKVLSPSQFHEITRKEQVLDVISGKPSESNYKSSFDESRYNKRPSKGDTSESVARTTANDMSNLYSHFVSSTGMTAKQTRSEFSSSKDTLKSNAHRYGDNILLPGRDARNGALVHERYRIDTKKARAMLSNEEISKISVKKPKLDKDKARMVLKPETYSKVFENRQMRVTVRE